MDVVSPFSSISCSSLLLIFSLLLSFLSTPPSQVQFLSSSTSGPSSSASLWFYSPPPPPPLSCHISIQVPAPLLFNLFPLFSPSSAPFCLSFFSSSLPVSVFPFPVCALLSSGSQSFSFRVYNILLAQVSAFLFFGFPSPLPLGSVSPISNCSVVPFSSLSCLQDLFCFVTPPLSPLLSS